MCAMSLVRLQMVIFQQKAERWPEFDWVPEDRWTL